MHTHAIDTCVQCTTHERERQSQSGRRRRRPPSPPPSPPCGGLLLLLLHTRNKYLCTVYIHMRERGREGRREIDREI
jgi:hypothetical protein